MLRRELPIILTLVIGFFMVLGPFIPARNFTYWRTEFEGWAIIITAFAAVLGVAILARLSVLKISRRERDWLYHIPLLAGLFVMIIRGRRQRWPRCSGSGRHSSTTLQSRVCRCRAPCSPARLLHCFRRLPGVSDPIVRGHVAGGGGGLAVGNPIASTSGLVAGRH
jgi:hypothetical protein